MRKLLKIVVPAPAVFNPAALLAFLLTAFLLAASVFPQPSLAQAARPHLKATHQGASAAPLLTGTDGSTTGVAKFQGNFTAITAPSGQVLALARQSGCSLLFLTGTYSNGSTFTYNSTSMTQNYERILHSEAGLTTTADSVPAGCVDPTRGIGSRPAAYVGKTTTGVNVYTGIFYNFMTQTESLYVLTGESNFSVSLLSFSRAGLLATADLNGDGNGDLVVVNGTNTPATAQVFVLLGNSDGTFQTAIPYTLPGATSLTAVIDDFNGDGKLDIVAASDNGQISLLTGKGDGTFNTAQSFAAPTPVYPGSTLTPITSIHNLISADLRGTGHRDLIASNGLVLLNDGTGNFTAASSAAFPPPTTSLSQGGPYLASGDLNRDGKTDIVLSTGYAVTTYTGKGDGTFTPGIGYVAVNTDGFITVTDIDGDGNPDIYIGDANGGLFRGDSADTNIAYALMGHGDGTFSGAPTIPGNYNGTNLGDVNGDGQQDIIVPVGSNYAVQLGTPKGTFTQVSTIPAPPATTPAPNPVGGAPVTVLTGNVTTGSTYAVGDLNGDGKADLLYLVYNVNEINPITNQPQGYPGILYFVSLSNGDGTFKTPVPYVLPQIAPSGGYDITLTADSLHIGDFNRDGKSDLIFNFSDTIGPTITYLQGLIVLPGNGDGTFGAPIITYTYNSTTAPSTATGSVPAILSTVDLNGDNNPDLVASNFTFAIVNGFGVSTNNVQIYTGKGDGTFNAPTTAITTNRLGQVAVADFNHDGKLDLAALGEIVSNATNTAQGQLFTALGNGNGTFATATAVNLSGGDTVPESGLAAADFDGDGNIDLAYLNPTDFSGLYFGKGDGTFLSVPFNGTPIPKDLINLAVGSSFGTIALDLNKDGHPDILSGNATLLSLYGSATTPTLFATTTALTATPTTITVGNSVKLTATITPAAGSTGSPTGTVTFLDGATTLGTGTIASGSASYTTSALIAGTHTITAVYAGDTAFSGSTSVAATVTVNAAGIISTTTIASTSAVNGTAVVGASITLTGTVIPASGNTTPTGTVTFADNAATLGTGTLTSGKATFTTTTLTVGTHSITAAYGGAATFSSSTSGALPLTITAAPASDFAITLSSATATVARSSSTLSTITITPTGGFKQSILLTVTGNPPNTTVTTSATTLTPADGVTAVTTTLTLQTSVTIAAQARRLHLLQFAAILPLIFPLGLVSSTSLFGIGFRRRRRLPLRLIALAAAAVLLTASGCGGSSKSPSTTNTPTPGTYILTITGTANVGTGTLTHTGTYTVTIQ